MPEISQEELDELRAAAAGKPMLADAPADAGPATVTLTVAQYEALRAKAQPAVAGGSDDAGGRVDPDVHTHVAILADGSRYEYAGAHPTAVGSPDGPLVPVISVHPLTL
jgi:hypothetical protein